MFDVAFCLAGVAAGIAAGLVPGLHVNNWLPFVALLPLGGAQAIYFAVAASMAYVFASFFPAILIGAPSADTALAVLPAHRLVMQGRAYTALMLSLLGGLSALFFSGAFLVAFAFFLPALYPALKFLVVPCLAAVVFVLMRAGWKAIPIVAVSSILGLLTFQYELLLPLLTGFFGLPTLALASGEVPAQPAVFNPVLRWPAILRLAFLGSFVSSFFSTLPAVSSSIAASAARLFGRLKPAEFMALLGSINCSYMMFSFFTLFLLGKARSGSAAFVSQFAEANLPFVFGIALFSGVLAVAVCMLLGRKAVSIYHRIRPARMRIIASGLLVAINFLLAGFFGLLVLATATAIGISAQLMRVERTACMAGLIVPAIAALL